MWSRLHPLKFGLPRPLLVEISMIWRTCSYAKIHVLFDNSRSFRMSIRMKSQPFSCVAQYGSKVTLRISSDHPLHTNKKEFRPDDTLTVNNFHDLRGCEGLLLWRSENSEGPTEVVFHQMSHDAANHHVLTGAAQFSQVLHLESSGNLHLDIWNVTSFTMHAWNQRCFVRETLDLSGRN